MAIMADKNYLVDAMRHHSKGHRVEVEVLDYGFGVALLVENKNGIGRYTTRLPNKTQCEYTDPERQMLYLMRFIQPNYRQSTKEDYAKYAVDFVKRHVSTWES